MSSTNRAPIRSLQLTAFCLLIGCSLHAQQYHHNLADDIDTMAFPEEYDAVATMDNTAHLLITEGYTSPNEIAVRNPSILPEVSFSLLDISEPDILLWSLKPAESGALAIRVWNMSASNLPGTFSFAGDVLSAYETTHPETETGPATVGQGAVQATLGRQRTESFSVYLDTITDTEGPAGPAICTTDIQVFPNPVTDTARIRLPAGIGRVEMNVIDLSGKVLIQRQLSGTISKIDTSRLPSGVYIFVFEGSEYRIAQKVIIL